MTFRSCGALARDGHVAILGSNFWPEATGSSQTVTEFAEFLVRRGHDVRVATSMPYYPQWEIWPEYRRAFWRKDEHKGMVILRSWHVVSPHPSTLTRLLHELSLAVFGLPNMMRVVRGAHMAFVVVPALSYALAGVIVAALAGVRRIVIVKDVMPDAAVELGMLRNPLLIALSRLMARWVYRLADEIHTRGEGMRARIERVSPPNRRIRIVPDTVDGAELAPVPAARNEFRRTFVAAGVFAVLHTGNMGRKQDLDLLLRAAARLQHEASIRFYVFGDGAERERFLKRRDELALSNISHFPLQQRWMLPHMLSGADVVLVSQLPEVVDIVVPSKLLTALGAGAMIVAACASESETARLVRTSGGG
ncbi:MAG: hypothetical protein AUI36_03090, partial [Cyanobacteria bacterium 13_1_40CM_2_61_4]